jgi:branched-chain amino acid transport system permease protein
MGIDKTRTKLSAFAMGATWAGMAGVVFAAKTTFINPASFTLWESIIILCVVVLGGMGSVLGVIFGALALILLPEYLRVFSEYRLLVFGAILVVMMVFRPGGIVSQVRRTYRFKGKADDKVKTEAVTPG